MRDTSRRFGLFSPVRLPRSGGTPLAEQLRAPMPLFLLERANEAPMSELQLTSIQQRVRVEYDEMPGLVLTVPQAARLWRLDTSVIEKIMASLVAADYLRQSPRGFVRRSLSN